MDNKENDEYLLFKEILEICRKMLLKVRKDSISLPINNYWDKYGCQYNSPNPFTSYLDGYDFGRC